MMNTPLLDFLAWTSLQPHRWLDLHEALATPTYYSPVGALHLLDEYQVDRAIGLLALDAPLACSEVASRRPVHDGFIAMLEVVPAASGNVRDALTGFVERERARDIEDWLRACYGDDPALRSDIRFRGMDYPAFDNGNVGIGFGLMLGRDDRRWLWSRVVFHHK